MVESRSRADRELIKQAARELAFIVEQAPPCPDPAEGGCVGRHCIACAAQQLVVLLQQLAARQ